MVTRFARFLVFSLLTVTASAQLTLNPATPKAGEPFTLTIRGVWRDSCVPEKPQAFVSGNRILITHTLFGGGCFSAGTPFETTTSLPGLAAGQYEVLVRALDYDGVVQIGRGTVVVSESDTPSLSVYPTFGGTSGGTVVALSGTFSDVTEVLFGSTPVAPEQIRRIGTAVYVLAPRHAAGPVDVTVRQGTSTWRRPGGFTYLAPEEVESFLVPSYTIGQIPGAYGSRWQFVLDVYNGNGVEVLQNDDVLYIDTFCPILCPTFGLAPHRTGPPRLLLGTLPAAGALIHVRKPLDRALAFSLRVQDASRQAETWGTEIPVLRESDMRSTIDLLNVPTDSRFRSTLRIYAAPDAIHCCAGARVEFHGPDDALLLETNVRVAPPEHSIGSLPDSPTGPFFTAGSPDFPLQASFAEISDLAAAFPELAGKTIARIRIFDGASRPIWAMVSVTNNATQHVTTITPH